MIAKSAAQQTTEAEVSLAAYKRTSDNAKLLVIALLVLACLTGCSNKKEGEPITVSGSAPAPPSAPSAPTGVSAAGAFKQITVSWSTVSGATSYNIYYGTSTGVTKATGTKITGATSPYAQSVASGTTNYYIVTAVGPGGESNASSEVNATST